MISDNYYHHEFSETTGWINQPDKLLDVDELALALRDDQEGQIYDAFLTKIRELTDIDRVALFVDSAYWLGDLNFVYSINRLRCVSATGIQRSCELSRESGIGRWVTTHGRILQRANTNSHISPAERANVQREFDLLNCHFAIPITDSKETIGVALLGPSRNRTSFGVRELHAAFHLLEQFCVFAKSWRRQNDLLWRNGILNQVLGRLCCGMMVVTPDLNVIQANSVTRECLGSSGKVPAFDEIPARLAEQIRGASERSGTSAPFFLTFDRDPQKRLFRITMAPLLENSCGNGPPLVVVLEDFSQVEAAKEAAVANAESRLAKQFKFLGGETR